MELERCPGCGNPSPRLVKIDKALYAMRCETCGWQGPQCVRKTDARKGWNARMIFSTEDK